MRRRALLTGLAAGTTTALAGCTTVESLFGGRVEETREYDFELADGAPVRVTTDNGDIDVTTHSDGTVSVEAAVAVPSEERLDDVTVEDSTVEGALAVDADVSGSTSRVSVDLDVRVPEGTEMGVVQSANGDVSVEGVASVTTARSSNGDVTVRDAGPVQSVATENGDVEADVPAPLEGPVLLRTENGDVDAAVSPDVDATVEARTQNGDVDVHDLALENREVSGTLVTGVLGEGAHELTAASTNGDVDLRRHQ